jgi:hypothetical protein
MSYRFLILLLLLCLNQPANCADENWYAPLDQDTHNNNPKLEFLLGDWTSIDPEVHFNESWSRSSSNMLIGVRTQEQCDLLVFERTRLGAWVTMRRMTNSLDDVAPNLLGGKSDTQTKHRGNISCAASGLDFKIVSRYDCPSQNLLNLELETTTTKTDVSTRTIHLKRVVNSQSD